MCLLGTVDFLSRFICSSLVNSLAGWIYPLLGLCHSRCLRFSLAGGAPRPLAISKKRKKRQCLRSQEKQALKTVRFQRHLPLTIQFYTSCRISGVPPLQSDFSGLSSALKDDTNEPKKRKEARTKPTKMARKKSTLRITTSTLLLHTLRTPTSNAL